MKERNSSAKNRAKKLVEQMTLEEKTSLLSYRSPQIPRLGIPAYNWWNEALHGVARGGTATMFPQVIGMAASFDEELIQRIATAIAIEGRAKYNESIHKNDRDIYKGLTFWCPNVNIFRDPRWGRGHETFGEDPYLTSRLGVAYIKGLQGDGIYLRSAACAKHFAVHSGPEKGRHSFNAEVSQKDLWETYLPAFEACIKEAGAAGIMGAYNRLNGEACCGSKKLLKDILRDKWGFEGYVVSDCGAIADFHMHHGLTNTAEESAALALNSGCDLNCGNIYLYVQKAVQDGLIEESAVDKAAEHLLATRIRLGLLDKTEYDDIPYEVVECKKHQQLSLEAARRSIVLLKNDGILPLHTSDLKTIGVIGPNANSRTILKGNYSGTASHYTTILEGILEEVGEKVRILYSEGSHLYRDRIEGGAFPYDRQAEAVSVAEHSDVVLLCLGLDPSIEGEEGDACNEYAAGDKKNLSFPETQRHLLEAVVETGKPIILCVASGGALDLSYAQEHVNAILQLWYPGSRGGKAAAEILFGKESPSGKLPVTFYRSIEDLPEFEDYSMKGRTYRYMKKTALFPFGFGLNYGDISCADANIEVCREEILFHVKVENKGNYKAGDVIQIYVKVLDSPYAVPNYTLCGIRPFQLLAGENKELHVKVSKDSLKVVDEQGNKRKDSKKYEFYVGCSQPDVRSEELTGKKSIKILYIE